MIKLWFGLGLTFGEWMRWKLYCWRAKRGKPALHLWHDDKLIHVYYYTGGTFVRSVAFARADVPKALRALYGVTGTFTWEMSNTATLREPPTKVVFDSWSLGTLRRGLKRAWPPG